jgi:hypothetical protein
MADDRGFGPCKVSMHDIMDIMISILFTRKHELRVLWLHAAISCAVDWYSTMVRFGSNSIQHN